MMVIKTIFGILLMILTTLSYASSTQCQGVGVLLECDTSCTEQDLPNNASLSITDDSEIELCFYSQCTQLNVEKNVNTDETVYTWTARTDTNEDSLLNDSGKLILKDGLGLLHIGNIRGNMTCE